MHVELIYEVLNKEINKENLKKSTIPSQRFLIFQDVTNLPKMA